MKPSGAKNVHSLKFLLLRWTHLFCKPLLRWKKRNSGVSIILITLGIEGFSSSSLFSPNLTFGLIEHDPLLRFWRERPPAARFSVSTSQPSSSLAYSRFINHEIKIIITWSISLPLTSFLTFHISIIPLMLGHYHDYCLIYPKKEWVYILKMQHVKFQLLWECFFEALRVDRLASLIPLSNSFFRKRISQPSWICWVRFSLCMWYYTFKWLQD